jgi:hypothetical protein
VNVVVSEAVAVVTESPPSCGPVHVEQDPTERDEAVALIAPVYPVAVIVTVLPQAAVVGETLTEVGITVNIAVVVLTPSVTDMV